MQALFGNSTDNGGNRNFVQNLDVRTRMLLCLVFSTAVVFIKDWYPLVMLLGASYVYVLAHGRFSAVLAAHGCVLVMFFLALFSIKIMVFFVPQMGDLGMGVYVNPFLRVIVLVNLLLALALSSRVQEIMTSLKSLGLPLFIYLPVTVMIRFIPSFIHDLKQISQSMKIKGYRVNVVSLTLHPLLTTRLLVVPLVIRALRCADELSIAAECKGIGYGDKITCFNARRLSPGDYGTATYALCLLALILMGRA